MMPRLRLFSLITILLGTTPCGCYVYEEELLYDTFPDGFAWGVATAAYQAGAPNWVGFLRQFVSLC